jgi:hypothetical protein
MGELTKASDASVQTAEVDKYEPFNTKSVIKTLEGLMGNVTSQNCTAETVNAACNCAARITDILRIHLDVERLKRTR